MRTFGIDISRYQSRWIIGEGWAFVIINCEDPGYIDKVNYCRELRIPWGLYTWIYPGNGRGDVDRVCNRAMLVGDPPLGYWLDYEQAGVTVNDLNAALDQARGRGIFDRLGVYTYLYIIRSIANSLQGRPLWLAYYPGNNDGSFPSGQGGDAREWGAVMWQYTSGANAPVGLDENVVIDDAWYEQFTGGGAAPAPTPKQSEDSMIYLSELGNCAHFQGNVKVREFTGPGAPPFGVPEDAQKYAGDSIPIRGCTFDEWLRLTIASNVALGKNPDGSTP